ncbi:MAG: GerMN domain-containing protein [Chloroflexi bacterium]|nr:GerMN domain-containing protein [Chloroflexota bacterium]
MIERKIALAVFGLLLTSCGQAQPAGQDTPLAAIASATPAPSLTSVSPATQPAELFFTIQGKLAPVAVQVSAASPARDAVEQLLKGSPDAQHSTEIPAAAKLQDISIASGTASVSFDAAFYAQGGASGTLLRLAQVTFTVTQFPSATSIRFLQDGLTLDVIGEGFPLNRALGRQDFPQALS